MVNLGRPDVEWLARLWELADEKRNDYPELYSDSEEELLKVTGELIRSLQ